MRLAFSCLSSESEGEGWGASKAGDDCDKNALPFAGRSRHLPTDWQM